jgi:hypothetical protein
MSDEPDGISRLEQVARDLSVNVDNLNSDSVKHFNEISRVSRLNRRLIIATAIGLILDITLTVLLGFGFNAIRENDAKISNVTAKLDFSENVVRKEVLCPIYKILLSAKNQNSANSYPAGPAAYNAFYAQLEQSFKAIDCGGN